jgi:pSer/pThr/pTyr-binding forkhead associated (FHA) protein
VRQKLIVNDGRTERELLLVGTMVVGRDPTCDISAFDPLLSRRHVEFVPATTGAIVRDLGSKNGFLLNGVKVAEGNLRAGDVIQIGHLQVKFIEENAPLVAPHEAVPDPEATVMVAAPAATPVATPSAEQFDVTIAPADRSKAAPPTAQPVVPSFDDLEKTIAAPRKPEQAASVEVCRIVVEETVVRETAVSQGPAAKDINDFTRAGTAGPERVREYSITVGNKIYRLTCSAAATEFARYEPVFARVAATFATAGRTD